ncbi:uracil permease [Clostridium oryzae]|uniref:Uracil permease n=1 Tax=Clostridium oryzae TaxID=1450648 RepID=A0A1V4ITV7_9CLOT|nr:uracil permease [Clostridium oryzae]OPJ63225.1 uracil permease [Clostridium oryzae]
MNNFVDVDERLPLIKSIPLSFQHLFAMVGATILVPKFLGMSPSIALFCSGIGTLLYILCTKGKLPAYIGSSFAFLTAMKFASQHYGVSGMLSGVIAAGTVYIIVAGIIKIAGSKWIEKAIPPVLIGSVVIVIGLSLAGTAAGWAGLLAEKPDYMTILVAAVTLLIGIIGSTYFKGFLGVIPILIAMVAGYILAFIVGVVTPAQKAEILHASLFQLPQFVGPKFNISAIIMMAPIAFVTLAEHIGHVYVTNSVCDRDFIKDPGLHRSILGDGIATIFAGFVGGPPNTTYGENIGVMAITKVYSVWVIGGAAVIAIILSFIGPVAAVIKYIPDPVIGGISILLFGIIASSGFRVLVENKIDFANKKNLVVSSVVIVLGISGAALKFHVGGSEVAISGVALATLVGIILTLVLPEDSKADE